MKFIELLKSWFGGNVQEERKLPPNILSMIEKQKADKRSMLENMNSARSNAASFGGLTDSRPENYYGDSFVPPEAFKDRMMPRKEDLDYLEDNVLNKTRQVGIPDALAASQWANESARGTSEDAVLRNNQFGLGPHWSFDSLDDSTDTYINTVLSRSGLGEIDEQGKLRLKSGVTADDLIEALKGIYETDMQDKTKYGRMLRGTPEWMFYNK